MEVNGWRLFQHALFKSQFEKLLSEAERIHSAHPDTFQSHKTVKLLARVTQLISEEIPSDPSHARWNQGNTLGKEYRHWKRAKFGPDRRYRLFFRFDAKRRERGKGKAIVYAWVSDDRSLRKEGDKNDPYARFARGLGRGEPPDSFDELLKQSQEVNVSLPEIAEMGDSAT